MMNHGWARSACLGLSIAWLGACSAMDRDASSAGTNGGRSSTPAAPAQVWRNTSDAPKFASVDIGDGHSLELKRLRVSTQIDGVLARTVVDHVFENPHGFAVEGTFHYPLPTEASVSYYAMYTGSGAGVTPDFFERGSELTRLSPSQLGKLLPEELIEETQNPSWGELRVGRVAEKSSALNVFEDITRRQIDPAVVEYVGPNNFEARVFPIWGGGYNRVIVAYEQTIPRVGDEQRYSFPVPEGQIDSFELTVTSLMDAEDAVHECDMSGVSSTREGQEITHHLKLEDSSPGGDMVVRIPAPSPVDATVGSDPTRDEDYVYARLTPPETLFADASPGAKRAIFALDTSLSESPDRFGVDVQLLEAILKNNESIEEFAVLTFDVGARWLVSDWTPNCEGSRSLIRDQLDGVLLEGATDFSRALDALAAPPFVVDDEVDVFVLTDGDLNWGRRDVGKLLREHEQARGYPARYFAYRTGIQAENLELFDALTKDGAIFNCLTTDSVEGCSTAHARGRLPIDQVAIVDADGASVVEETIVAGERASLFPQSQLVVAARVLKQGAAFLQVKSGDTVLRYPIELQPRSDLAPRAWAELVTARLLSARDPALDRLALAYSQHYRLVNRVASLLVLETDEEYQLYGLDTELKRLPSEQVVENVAQILSEIEPASDFRRLTDLLQQQDQWNHLSLSQGGQLIANVAAQVDPSELTFPRKALEIPLVFLDSSVPDYVSSLTRDSANTGVYRKEAQRRQQSGQVGTALRALSSLVENNPGSAQIARMVGYQLLSWGEHEAASGLFLSVLEARPFEPVSYRDLALALRKSRPALAALLYEAVIAGSWDARFGQFVTVAEEEYALMINGLAANSPMKPYLLDRKAALGLSLPVSDVRVTMTWNTDNTDIDLWVDGPKGRKCFYGNRKVRGGSRLLEDMTSGFGPERFHDTRGDSGTYEVQAHYYGNNGNLLTEETHVNALIVLHAGQANEKVSYADVVLEHVDQVKTLAKIRY